MDIEEISDRVNDALREVTQHLSTEPDGDQSTESSHFVRSIVHTYGLQTEEKIANFIREVCTLSAHLSRGEALSTTGSYEEENDVINTEPSRRIRRRLNREENPEGESGDIRSEGERLIFNNVSEMRGVLLRVMEFWYYASKMITTLRASHHVLSSLDRAQKALSGDTGVSLSSALSAASTSGFALAAGISRFSNIETSDDNGDGKELNPVQQLIIYMLNILQDKGYRRCGTDCYEQIVTEDGRYTTRAWKHACSIESLIIEMTQKELSCKQWFNLTRGKGNLQYVSDYLSNCRDVQFPALQKDRHVFAFKNGLYITKRTAIIQSEAQQGDKREIRDAFIPYGEHEMLIPEDVAACKYFDVIFPVNETFYLTTDLVQSLKLNNISVPFDQIDSSWKDIPTPFMQSIMDYQQFPSDVIEWAYALIGRLLYEINEVDGWQVMPFLKGQAGSGKSTLLLNVCRYFYDVADVTVLSNNIERKFGLSSLDKKYLFVAPEIKSDLQLDQAEFQSIVSGETLQLAVKHQNSRTVDWRVPGILAGNEVPNWVDNSGSISRRIILFEFKRKVENGDTELGQKLQMEIPYILLKCNRAYHAKVREVGARNVWNLLPEYFVEAKKEMARSINPIEHFMTSGKLVFHRDAYMPFKVWKEMFNSHCEHHNFGKVQLIRARYEPVMYPFNVVIQTGSRQARPYPRGPNGDGPLVQSLDGWCNGMEPAGNDMECDDRAGGSVFD